MEQHAVEQGAVAAHIRAHDAGRLAVPAVIALLSAAAFVLRLTT